MRREHMPWLWLVALMGAGCATDPVLLSVPVEFEGAPVALEVGGVEVTLTEASLTLSDLHLSTPAQARRWSLLSTAYAHPGHDFSGDVRGELTGTWTLDLLDPGPTTLGSASLYEGNYETGRIYILEEPAGILRGSAGGIPVEFPLSLSQEVTGLDFLTTVDAAEPPQRLVLSVDLGHALSYSDWSTPDADGDQTLTASDGLLGNTVPFGVTSTPTWLLTLEQP